MSPSLIVSLLSQRPRDELERLRDKMLTDRSRLEADLARVQVELDQVDEALGQRTRRDSRSGEGQKGASTRQRVLDILAEAGELMSPVEIIAALSEQGKTPTRGAVYTLLGRLLDANEVERVDSRYRLLSRGHINPEAFAEPARNGDSESPSTATQPQEGAQEVLGS